MFRYGKGFGLLQHVVGKDHWLNQPNTVFGLAFYTILIIMGELHSDCMIIIKQYNIVPFTKFYIYIYIYKQKLFDETN